MQHNLDNQNLLLMYLADELSADQRARVEEQLTRDALLRGQLEQLRNAHGIIADGLAALDAVEPLPVTGDVAQRRVGRAIAQWQVDRLVKPAAQTMRIHRTGMSWVRYASAVAAVLLVGTVLVWSLIPDDKLPVRSDQYVFNSDRGTQNVTTDDDEVLVAAMIAPPDVGSQSGSALDNVERELLALSRLSNPETEQEATP